MNYFSYFTVSAVINFIASLVIGFFVVSKNFKSKINRQFFLLCLSVATWSLFYFFWQISTTEYWALFYCKLLMLGAIYMPFTFYSFVGAFLDKSGLYILVGRIGAACSLIFVYLFLFTPYMMKGVVPLLGFNYWPIAGDYFSIFLIVFFGLFMVPGVMLYREYLLSTGMKRSQIKYLFTGIFLAFIAGSTNFLLWYQVPIKPYANIFVSAYAILTGYAVIRYRLMDVRVAIKRSLIFALLVVIISAIFSATAYIFTNYVQALLRTNSILLSGILTGVIVAIGFEPIKKLLTRATNKYLFTGQYDPQLALSETASKIASILNLEMLAKTVALSAYKVLKYNKIKIYIKENAEDQIFTLIYKEGEGGGQSFQTNNLIYVYYQTYEKDLDDKQILVADEVRYLKSQSGDEFLGRLADYLERHGIQVVVPMYLKNSAQGYILFGEKKSGDSYSNEDLNFIKVMAGQVSVAFENARLYEVQKKFSDKLQEEVDKATIELKVANKELKKLDQAKSEFISIASHQLRTPMTVIKGYFSMIKDGDFGPLSEPLLKPVNSVQASTNRLLLLIEDLLNISRIESGRMQYEYAPADIGEIVQTVFNELKNHAAKKNLEFVYFPPKEPLPKLLMDQAKIREVVMNLADNALKYTDTGKVEVHLELADNEIKYYVKDTGRGMSDEDIGNLFKKFSRVGSSQLVHTEGTGLGLYIAKQIIKKHYGKIWAESQGTGKGSIFALALKIKNPKLEAEVAKTNADKLAKEKITKVVEPEYREDTIDMSRIKRKSGNG